MWARDFLPKHGLDDARIMTYGYEALLTDRGGPNRCRDFAASLLDALEEERDVSMVCDRSSSPYSKKRFIESRAYGSDFQR